jgi:hemolysin D
VINVSKDAILGEAALLQQKNGWQPVSGGGVSQTAAAEPTSDLDFPVMILSEKTCINPNGTMFPISSGMSVMIEIKTGSRRAIQYMWYPLIRKFSPILGEWRKENSDAPEIFQHNIQYACVAF